MLRRLSWDCSDVTDAPAGHIFWNAPRDGNTRIHHVEHEAPREDPHGRGYHTTEARALCPRLCPPISLALTIWTRRGGNVLQGAVLLQELLVI
jgi:hypothetical protein